jgi:hypothetical protein
MPAPPSIPATKGLLAIPASDALVSTPNPAPCAPAGMTLPAAAYDAVIATPTPMPKTAAAADMIQIRSDTAINPHPIAAAAAADAITIRVG